MNERKVLPRHPEPRARNSLYSSPRVLWATDRVCSTSVRSKARRLHRPYRTGCRQIPTGRRRRRSHRVARRPATRTKRHSLCHGEGVDPCCRPQERRTVRWPCRDLRVAGCHGLLPAVDDRTRHGPQRLQILERCFRSSKRSMGLHPRVNEHDLGVLVDLSESPLRRSHPRTPPQDVEQGASHSHDIRSESGPASSMRARIFGSQSLEFMTHAHSKRS